MRSKHAKKLAKDWRDVDPIKWPSLLLIGELLENGTWNIERLKSVSEALGVDPGVPLEAWRAQNQAGFDGWGNGGHRHRGRGSG